METATVFWKKVFSLNFLEPSPKMSASTEKCAGGSAVRQQHKTVKKWSVGMCEIPPRQYAFDNMLCSAVCCSLCQLVAIGVSRGAEHFIFTAILL